MVGGGEKIDIDVLAWVTGWKARLKGRSEAIGLRSGSFFVLAGGGGELTWGWPNRHPPFDIPKTRAILLWLTWTQ